MVFKRMGRDAAQQRRQGNGQAGRKCRRYILERADFVVSDDSFNRRLGLLMNSGDKPVVSKNNLLATIAWKIGEEVTYALEGSIFVGGAIVQWLRDGLGIIRSSGEVETLAPL